MSQLTRTNSSPNLKAATRSTNREWETQLNKFGYDTETAVDDDDEFFVIGDRVYVDGHRLASVAYFGELEFAPGDWVGVVLDEPTGNHAGKVHGYEYFQCAPFHGLFVRPHRVGRVPDSALGSSAASSRAPTPLPTIQRLQLNPSRASNQPPSQRSASRSPAASTVDSYFYDEDYRLPSNSTRQLGPIRERTGYKPNISRSDSLELPAPKSGGILKPTNGRSSNTRLSSPQLSSPIKKHPIEVQNSSLSSKVEDLTRRVEEQRKYNHSDNHDRSTVFNFRPKREQLDDYQKSLKTSNNLHLLASSYKSPTKTLLESPMSSYYTAPSWRSTGGRVSVDLSSPPIRNGDRVSIRSERGDLTGYLRFMGETEFATGEWAGVELDRAEGKNDGSVLGVRYFHCPDGYGLFVPATRVKRYDPATSQGYGSNPIFKQVRSTITSPPPVKSAYSSRSVSTTPSYTDSPTPYSSYSATNDSRRLYSSGSASSLASPINLDSSSRSKYDSYDGYPLKSNSNLLNYSTSLWPSSNNTKPYSSYGRQYSSSGFESSGSFPKFNDSDLDYQLRKSLYRPTNSPSTIDKRLGSSELSSGPKSIKYTFSSSKYNGNPIVRRIVEYT